jgi:hypothetical protein
MVESQPSKLLVASSILVSRSISHQLTADSAGIIGRVGALCSTASAVV